jgi:glycosyltransferase involved in cell wall biosynthesis
MTLLSIWAVMFGSLALLWLTETVRVFWGMTRLPKLRTVSHLSDDACPRVSILVAARDAAAELPHALPTLLDQDYPQYDVIVVDDRSTDATGRILDEFTTKYSNLKVVHLTHLPPGWIGKPHALARAYEEATGEWVVFTDADVRIARDVLRRVMGMVKENRWDHLNVLPHLELVGFWEKTMLSFWALSSIVWLEPWRVSDPDSGRYFGFGALQALRRDVYEEIGTHRRLAMEIVDDIKLGKLVKQAGWRSGVAIAGDRVQLRYVNGLSNIIHSISKSAFAACNYRISRVVGSVLATFIIYVLPFVALIFTAGIVRVLAAIAVVCILTLHGKGLIAVRVSPFYAATHPLGAIMLCYILLHSTTMTLWRGGVIWRDTFYPLDELRNGLV